MSGKSISELVAVRHEITTKIDILKTELSGVDVEIAMLAEPYMNERLRNSKKDSGSLRLDVSGTPIQGEIRKTIKWNSDALKVIASQIPDEDAAMIFTVEFSISEEQLEILEECEHPALGQILMARTVKLSPFSARPVKQKDG